MAYTYDQFVSEANNAGLMDRFSKYDLEAAQKSPEYGISLLSLLQDSQNAKTSEQQLLANEAANQLRKNYGVYSTGDADSGYGYASSYGSTIDDLLSKINNYGSFAYDQDDAYKKILEGIANHQPFQYDLESDPSWSSYKKRYLREGDRASANALAQASAASGGRASSYAMNAAQQAGNYYAGQLSDIIPTLEQNAYSRYISDFNNNLSALSAMQSDRSFDYEAWMDEYNMLQNSLGNYQGQDETDYQRYLDQYNQAYQEEQDRLTQEQLKYENALALYQALGYATPEVAEILGIKSSSGDNNSSGNSGTGTGGPGGSGGGDDSADAAGPTGDATAGEKYDMASIINLGYGPISAARLSELIAAGEVEEYQENGVWKYRKVEKEQPIKTPLYDLTQNLLTGAGAKKGTTTGGGPTRTPLIMQNPSNRFSYTAY